MFERNFVPAENAVEPPPIHGENVGSVSQWVAFQAAEDAVMGWATGHIAKLQAGDTVSFRPRGNSMSGKIESGQLCTVAPVDPETLDIGDIVLCKVNGREYLHLVKAIQGPRYQIGNNKGRINGWVSANAIFGKLITVET